MSGSPHRAAATSALAKPSVCRAEDPANPGDGYTHAPPIPEGIVNLCTQPFDVVVPLAGSPRRVVKIRTRSANAVVPVARRNLSALKLVCRSPG